MSSIINIEGIGPEYSSKLSGAGIETTEALLEKGATPGGRAELEDATGIGHKLILEWVNLADLFRINGMSEEYSDLLEEAGVDTVVELAQRKADNLHEKVIEVNQAKKLVRQPPGLSMIEDWINQAKELPRKVEY